MHLKKKICLLGSYGVGKTSLVRKFVYNKFEEKYLSTLGVHISKKEITVNIKESIFTIELYLWDIANIEKFEKMVKTYLKGAHGGIIVTDVTRNNTVDLISETVEMFIKINPDAKLVFAENKSDLLTKQYSNNESISNLLKKYKSKSYLTSAKTGQNVDDLFQYLGLKFIEDLNA